MALRLLQHMALRAAKGRRTRAQLAQPMAIVGALVAVNVVIVVAARYKSAVAEIPPPHTVHTQTHKHKHKHSHQRSVEEAVVAVHMSVSTVFLVTGE